MPPLVGRWTTVGGFRVYSRVAEASETSMPPIVHIHGFAISGRYLEPTAVRLASHYPTHVPDLPGHGYSEKPRRPLDIPELAEALAGYLEAVGLPRAVVLGNSTGCLVAAEFAHRYPERTEAAILVSPAGGQHNRPLLRGLVQLARDGLREPPSLARLAIPDYVRFGLVNSVHAFHRMIRYPTVERLSHVPVPFLAVIGARDPLVSVSQMERILRSPADMDLVRRVDAAHAINFSHPESLARIVDAYLRGQPLPELMEDTQIIATKANEEGNERV
ncbi:MAG: alpha/beta fold hydrolase [Chloroflexi bacterium]|nr:alpha/beta fold hydrolase [Chloroflexota bacterium]